MGEICPKTESYPPSQRAKINFNPPSHNDNIKANHCPPPPPRPPCCKKSPPIDSLIPGLLVGFLPLVQTSLQMTLRQMPKSHLKSHQNHGTLSLCHLCMNWLGDSSSSSASLALRFPCAWVRTQEFLSDWASFFEAQFNHTVLYLPYLKLFVLLLKKFQQLGFSCSAKLWCHLC